MARVAPTAAEFGNPKPSRATSQDTAWEGDRKASGDPFERFDSILAQLAGRAAPPQRWPKRALFAACVAVLAAGWWFYRDDAGHRSERTIAPALAGEIPASPNQATKPAELDGALQQAESLSRTYEEMLEKEWRISAELKQKLAIERRISAALDQKLATREKDDQLLVQERARTKDLEEQLSARQNDQAALVQERARSQHLERQLAARQGNQETSVEERARIRDLEQQLAVANLPAALFSFP